MQDVDKIVFQYAEAKRHLWNTVFMGLVGDLRDCEPFETFAAIDNLLFMSVVCGRLGIKKHEDLVVRPRPELDEIPLMISTDPGHGRWAEPARFRAKDATFRFVEFFDWDRYGSISLSMVRARVVTLENDPTYQGREVLAQGHLVTFEVAMQTGNPDSHGTSF